LHQLRASILSVWRWEQTNSTKEQIADLLRAMDEFVRELDQRLQNRSHEGNGSKE
jgi:hypothetical protein